MPTLIEELTITELKLPSIANLIPQMLWVTDASGKLTDCNKQWADYMGLTIEEAVAGQWLHTMHPDDIPETFKMWENAIQTQTSFEATARRKHVHGSAYRWFLIRGNPIKNNQDQLLGWVGTNTDIEDLKTATESLQDREKQYNTLVEALHSIYWTVDPVGAVIEPQAAWGTFSGQAWEEYKDFGWTNTIHPEDRESTLNNWNKAVKSRQLYQHIARFWSATHKDYVYCVARAAPFIDKSGNIVKWIGSCLIIDEQKKIEARLQEVSQHLELALESANIAAWILNLNDKRLSVDNNFYKLFGLTPDNSIKYLQDYRKFVHPDDVAKIEKSAELSFSSQSKEYHAQYRIILPDGSLRFITSKGKTYVNEKNEKTKMIGLCFDVTEQKNREALMQQGQVNFLKNLKTDSVAEISSYYAHELNQPLAAINTFVQGCIHQIEKNQYSALDITHALKEAGRQIERMGNIIQSIKNSVTKKQLHFEYINFKDIVNESIQFIHYGNQNNAIQINHHVNNNIPMLKADKIQIQQVIINLLQNSIDSLREYKTQHPSIFINYIEEKNMLLVKVADNGPGFPAEMKKHLDIVMSTKITGMGIGLSICRSIIEAHGGNLTINETLTCGAQIQFTIPIQREVEHA